MGLRPRITFRIRGKPTSLAQTLPVEVLCLILDISANIDPPCGVWRPRLSLGCIQIAHVCARWRNIALEFSNFWGKILGDLPAATGVLFERTRSAPLTIRPGAHGLLASANARFKQHLTTQALALLHPDRIGVLDLSKDYGISDNNPHFWLPLMLQPGFGRSLTILNINQPVDSPIDFTGVSIRFNIPHLRQVTYAHTHFIFVSPALRSLTLDMTINGLSARRSPPVLRFHDFLETVRHTSCLQELRFAFRETGSMAIKADDVFKDTLAPISVDDIIPLPTLRYIGLDGSLRLCTRVLHAVDAPPDTTIHYYMRDVRLDQNTDFTSHMANLLQCMLPQLQYTGHQSVALGISSRKLDLGLSCRVNVDRVWPAERHIPHICLSVRFRGEEYGSAPEAALGHSQYAEVMGSFLDLVRTPNIRTLDTTLCHVAQPQVLGLLCQHTFPSLEELAIDINSPAYMCALLDQPSAAPELHRLCVVNTRRERSGERWEKIWSNLTKALEDTGHRITLLRFCAARFVRPEFNVELIWATRWFWRANRRGITRTRKLVERVTVETGPLDETLWIDWSDEMTWSSHSGGAISIEGRDPYDLGD
ncbi:unnamed protein product [Peniophora sp. CBMAI 1063]|nr:unnamed protein product [Peniophora sp. CBMAI 1063]